MTADRILYNEPDSWLGPDYAVDMVDEVVVSGALVHLEMMSDTAAYLGISRGPQLLHLSVYARPTTRRERRQVLAHGGDRLIDHLGRLWSGRVIWSPPWWRRPGALLRSWREASRAARAVLCVEVRENDLVEDGPPAAAPSRAELVASGDMGPGCGNPTCPCETNPWPQACDVWEGGPPGNELRFCPRCGWASHRHHDVPAGECDASTSG